MDPYEDILLNYNNTVICLRVSKEDADLAKQDSDFASHLVEQALGGDDANLEKDTETFENDPETFSKQPELDANVNDASVQQEEKTYEDESCNELLWVESSVKLMLSLYENCFLKVGHTVKLKTKKKMWENITTEMVQKGYKFTCAQIQNKFKTLERRYKGVIDNNNRTGRQKISCPYERELSNIFCKNPAVHPKYLLEAKEGVATSNSETEQEIENVSPNSLINKNIKTPMKRNSTSVAEELRILREDRKEACIRKESLQKEKIEAYKKRTTEIERRNNLMEQYIKQGGFHGDI